MQPAQHLSCGDFWPVPYVYTSHRCALGRVLHLWIYFSEYFWYQRRDSFCGDTPVRFVAHLTLLTSQCMSRNSLAAECEIVMEWEDAQFIQFFFVRTLYIWKLTLMSQCSALARLWWSLTFRFSLAGQLGEKLSARSCKWKYIKFWWLWHFVECLRFFALVVQQHKSKFAEKLLTSFLICG